MASDTLVIRRAREADLPQLIALFADDPVGGHGDTSEAEAYEDYLRAFHVIDSAPHEQLYVAELAGEVVATYQLTFLRALTGRGAQNAMIEAVQTRADMRGKGIGAALMEHAEQEARRRDCRLLQLMSNAARTDAHRFYERAGFARSHLGFKRKLK
ncbi:N-acetylglutamate synthase, GNAT family [Rhizobium sp. RU35A]|uniref:GNAT family N-acetyltransferase n=1 Tax=Rhizobium sp. RU35A TaxID=1907414 RepID=UPI0009560A6D|nr:GNAT family N-acetyltransferase [Rhizobium sp. RU35A]SIR17395.1 N-acetylglutamate synthase, GNAT family [Rhizobium sp. RU35A]